jgi:hypothetical protein
MIHKEMMGKSSNSAFVVRFAHAKAFGTLQTRRTLYAISAALKLIKEVKNMSKKLLS